MSQRYISVKEVQAAIDLCFRTNPVNGSDHRMHPEANRLADLFCGMLVTRQVEISSDEVPADVLALLTKWNEAGTAGADTT